jgi:hypothetical protein
MAMGAGSTLDPENLSSSQQKPLKGHDTGSLGPSDSSDSGSDVAGGVDPADDDSDRYGTGERAAAGRLRRTRTDTDLDTDQVVDGEEVGVAGSRRGETPEET